jgi:hypothetical protein
LLESLKWAFNEVLHFSRLLIAFDVASTLDVRILVTVIRSKSHGGGARVIYAMANLLAKILNGININALQKSCYVIDTSLIDT